MEAKNGINANISKVTAAVVFVIEYIKPIIVHISNKPPYIVILSKVKKFFKKFPLSLTSKKIQIIKATVIPLIIK
tara:strand:+ start:838 stop:1062 length:225 start_codon:yes stop_codon:yes gene_type:complete